MIMQKYKISPFLILFHFREKSASRLLGLIFLDAYNYNYIQLLIFHPVFLHPFKKTEEKETETKLVWFEKGNAEIQSRITLHSRKQFEIILLADDADFSSLFFPPPRSISVHAASLHFPAGFSAAKSRGFPKLPYSRECTRVSLPLSLPLSLSHRRRNNEKGTTYHLSPSPYHPCSSIRRAIRARKARVHRERRTYLKYFRTCAVKENKNE